MEGAQSRVKVVRALLASAERLRQAAVLLKRLGKFDKRSGFAQYHRSQALLEAALQAGLADDPEWGTKVQNARDEIEALKQQRRVLEDWDGAYNDYRQTVLQAFLASSSAT